MSGLELLEKYPEAAKVVMDFYITAFMNGLNEEYKKDETYISIAKAQFSEPMVIGRMIDSSPRFLFDVFDANEVYIQTIVYPDKTFTCNVNELGTTKSFPTRKEAEIYAIEHAFGILNEKL